MIKSVKKTNRISLQDLQTLNTEQERCKKSPLYFYNTYIRKEGQPVLTQEEYDKLMKEWEDARYSTTLKKRDGNTIYMKPINIKDNEQQKEKE